MNEYHKKRSIAAQEAVKQMQKQSMSLEWQRKMSAYSRKQPILLR